MNGPSSWWNMKESSDRIIAPLEAIVESNESNIRPTTPIRRIVFESCWFSLSHSIAMRIGALLVTLIHGSVFMITYSHCQQ